MESASGGASELPGGRPRSPQPAGNMDEVDAMDVDQHMLPRLSVTFPSQPSGGQGHDRMNAVEGKALAAIGSFATADQHNILSVPGDRDEPPSASAPGSSTFVFMGSQQAYPLRPASNPSLVSESLDAAAEAPYASCISASDVWPARWPPRAGSEVANRQQPCIQATAAQPTAGGQPGPAQSATAPATSPGLWAPGMTVSVAAGPASPPPSALPAEGGGTGGSPFGDRGVPVFKRCGGGMSDQRPAETTATAVVPAAAAVTAAAGGDHQALAGARMGGAAEGPDTEDSRGVYDTSGNLPYIGPGCGEMDEGRHHDGAAEGDEMMPEAVAGLQASYMGYGDDSGEGQDEGEEEAEHAAGGGSAAVTEPVEEQGASGAVDGGAGRPPHRPHGATSLLRQVYDTSAGDSAGDVVVQGRTAVVRQRGQNGPVGVGAGGGVRPRPGSNVADAEDSDGDDDDGDGGMYDNSVVARWYDMVDWYDAARAVDERLPAHSLPQSYNPSRPHDYNAYPRDLRQAGLRAGGDGGAGPSTSVAAAGGAGASGRGDGGLLLQPCPGPELVTADPWSEDEDEDTDTTAEQFYTAAHPKDIQGIPWDRLQFDRSTYRDTRLRQYRNYTNVLPDDDGGAYRAELAPLCAVPRRCGTAGVAAARGPPFFSFVRNSRAVQSNIVHFQLRNLVWATSPNDVFVVHDNCVNHWSPAARTVTEVLNLAGGGGPRAGGSGRVPGLGRVQVSTLCVSGDLVAAGGFMGELVVKRLSGTAMQHLQQQHHHQHHHHHHAATGAAGGVSAAERGRAAGPRLQRVMEPHAAAAAGVAAGGDGGGAHSLGRGRQVHGGGAGAGGGGKAGGGGGTQGSLLYCGRITSSDNGITNGLEIFRDRSHGTVIMAANNDSQLRLFAAGAGEGGLRQLARWPFDWAVNYATVRPGSHLAAVVGDAADTLLTDVHNGATVAKLHGHRDFSFAAAWHPGGMLLATGNQDTTTLVWDVRRTDEPLTRLAGRMGAIRSLRFTPDGRFLAMSEPADFVHVYDVASGFQDCQEHDFFGEIAGIAFTPDSSSLFVGISDLTYASLMQLERQKCDWL